MIKKFLTLVGAFIVLQNVHAQFTFPVYEPFSEYPDGERLRTAGSSGNYWTFGNSVSSSSSAIISSTNAVSYPGLQPDPNNPARGIWGASAAGRTAAAPFTSQNAGTIYLSFLFEPVTLPAADRPIIGLNPGASGTPNPGSGPSVWITPTGQLKIDKNSSSTPFTNTTPALTLGSTYLVVMGYTFANGEVDLWVNPTRLGNNGNVPSPTISSTNGTSSASLQSLCLYSGTGISPSFNLFDELRVDTSWAGVTPASPSPGNVYNVTGGGFGCPGDAFAVGLSGSDASGLVYLLYTNGAYSGQSVAGNGSAVTFGPQTVTATYSVLASNTVSGNVGWMSGDVTVSVQSGPSISGEPSSVVVATNGYTTFKVTASGDGLDYQWYKNGSALSDNAHISGSTTPTLTIYPAGPGDAATAANGYYVIITNSCGLSATSSPIASLTLDAPANLVWQGGNPDSTWDLATTANWTNASGNLVTFNAGDNVTFDDTSANLVVLLKGDLAPTSVNVSGSQGYFLGGSGSITGPASLMVSTAGSVTISNVNTYTGGTTILNGSVIIRNTSERSLGTGTLTMGGGTLEIAQSSGAANVGISNNINLTASSTLQFDGTGTYGFNLLNGLNGSPAATLTLYHYVNTPGAGPDRVRLYGTFTNNSPIAITTLGNMVEFAPYNDSGFQVYNGVISGSVGHILTRGNGTVILNGANTINDSGEIGNTSGLTGYGTILSGGVLGVGADSVSSSPPTIDSSPVGTGNLGIDVTLGNDVIFASGGAHTIANPVVYTSATNSVQLIVGGTNNLTLSGAITLSGADNTGGTNRILQITNSALTTFSGVIGDAALNCGIIKAGSGVLVLSGINTYDGPTVVSNGTLRVNGQIDTNVVTVAGGSLAGSGTILGPVTVAGGGTLAPGATGIGTLTIQSDLALGGNALFKVNKSLSPSNDTVVVTGTPANSGTGTLTVTNLGPALAVGDKFTLFSKPVSTGNTLTVTGAGVTWTNRLALDGSIAVLSTTTLPNTPTNISFSVSSGIMTITWPGSYLGWQLEAQTNPLGTGLNPNSNAWYVISGSAAGTNATIPINPSSPSVFYRLAHP